MFCIQARPRKSSAPRNYPLPCRKPTTVHESFKRFPKFVFNPVTFSVVPPSVRFSSPPLAGGGKEEGCSCFSSSSLPFPLSFPRKRESITDATAQMDPRLRGDDGKKQRTYKPLRLSSLASARGFCPFPVHPDFPWTPSDFRQIDEPNPGSGERLVILGCIKNHPPPRAPAQPPNSENPGLGRERGAVSPVNLCAAWYYHPGLLTPPACDR